MNIEERIALIKRNTVEIVTEEELRTLLETKKEPVVYLGNAVTGRPHIAYFLWILKLKDFLDAGFKVKLLLADLHGALDNCPWELLDKRYEYYKQCVLGMLYAVGSDPEKIEFVRGSDIQKDGRYFEDVLKIATQASTRDAIRAGSEVVKQSDNPKVAGLIYPIMQALDEEYLDVDVQYGGLDQRKILMFAREYLPKIGYKARIEVMTPMIPGLIGEKMSASDPNSKIDLLDNEKTVKKKINKAECVAGEINNGLLAYAKNVLFVINDTFVIERPEKFGGTITYDSYEQLEQDFAEQKLHPMDLKMGVAAAITSLLDKAQEKIDAGLGVEAYPEE